MSGTVTAVIPTTGTRQDQLLRALESVRLQSYPVIETVIVVDADESATSGVRALVANLDFPCPVIIDRLVGSTGPAAARNRAVELSNGEWVALLDDDDVWESNKLAKQLPWATARDLDACGTRSTLMTSTGTLIYPRKLLHVGDNVVDYFFGSPSALRPAAYIAMPSFLVRRNLLIAHPFPEQYRILEDYAWLISLYRCGARIAVHPETLVRIDEMESPDRQSRRTDPRVVADWGAKILGDFPEAQANFMAIFHVRSVAVSEGWASALIAWVRACTRWPPPRLRSAAEGLLMALRPAVFPVWVQRVLRHIRR